MSGLRWSLIAFGIALLGAIYLFARYSPIFRARQTEINTRRQEPVLSQEEAEPVFEPINEVPDDEPEVEPEPVVPNLPDPAESKIVTVRLVPKDGGGFSSEKLILAMREEDLRHGEFGIFHRANPDSEDRYLFSVASLREPGSFDLTKLRTERYPGVSFFMMLPGPVHGVDVFDEMLRTARQLAQKMDGELLDDQGSTLSVQRERYLREEIIQFEHQTSAL
jgi:cell division protein ZipA